MPYEPPRVWLELSGSFRKVHISPTCDRIKPDSELAGPLLIGQAATGKSTSFCRCARGHEQHKESTRSWREVSGGLPTLGRRS